MISVSTLRSPARAALAVACAGLFGALALGCDSGSPTDPGGGPGPPPGPGPSGLVLAAGELRVPAAIDSDEPGFHEVFFVLQRLRPDLAPTAGRRLVVTLRDLTRPGQQCASDEPEDGCVTIDWSADPAEPRTPANGLFVNRLRLTLEAGERDYFLSRTMALNDVPDLIDPNRRHTPIGGLPIRWQTVLPTNIVPGSDLELRLVLTKWQPPEVRIGFAVELLD